MANIVGSKILKCPDYGDIEIAPSIPTNVLLRFLKSKIEVKSEFILLLKAIIKTDSFELSKLTDADYEFIVLQLANTYEVGDPYSTLRKTISREEAFREALKKSPFISASLMVSRTILEQMSQSVDIYKKLMYPSNMFQKMDMFKATLKQNRALEEAIKNAAGISGSIGKAFDAFQFRPLYEDIFKKCSVVDSFRESLEFLSKDFFKLVQASKNVWPELTRIVQLASFSSEKLAEALGSVSKFNNVIDAASRSISEPIKEYNSVLARLKFSNETIKASNRLVLQANDYFSMYRHEFYVDSVFRFPGDLERKGRELDIETRKSEFILENESSKSIIFANGLANEIFEIKKKIEELHEFKPLMERIDLLQSPKSIMDCLRKFSVELQNNYYRIFWDKHGTKLIQSPERCAQSHLGIYLKGYFGGVAFVGKEIIAGNGFIDLLVHFIGKIYIVELKIVGNGWSIQDAEDGLSQLDTYMQSYNENESYLIVLDGRKTDKGKQLKEEYKLKHGTVYVIRSKIYWRGPSS